MDNIRNKNKGFILLHRQILDHWIFNDSQKLRFWLHLLFRANFSNTKVNIGNQLIDLERGSFIASLEKLGLLINKSRETARAWLKLLQQDQMIEFKTTSKYTLIKIINYENFQASMDKNLKQKIHRMETEENQAGNNLAQIINYKKEKNNINNENNGNSVSGKPETPPSPVINIFKPILKDIQNYFSEKKIDLKEAEKFFNYYEANGWKVGKNPMKNWQAAANSWISRVDNFNSKEKNNKSNINSNINKLWN